MTTPQAEAAYLAEHLSSWGDRNYAAYNPHGKLVEELPTIFGFNNGGSPGWYSAALISEDGHCLGGHVCSAEAYMPHDLGIVEGARPDRHETFREHYPDGYRMDFVKHDDERLEAAYQRLLARRAEAPANEEAA